MKKKVVIKLACLVFAGSVISAYAADAGNGKKLFEDANLGGGTTGRSCATCHPGGKGLSTDVFKKSKDSLADIVNKCIEKPLGGKAIDPHGQDMEDIIEYMKTLTGYQK